MRAQEGDEDNEEEDSGRGGRGQRGQRGQGRGRGPPKDDGPQRDSDGFEERVLQVTFLPLELLFKAYQTQD